MRVKLVDRSAAVITAADRARHDVAQSMGEWLIDEIRHSISKKEESDNPYLVHQLSFGGTGGPQIETGNEQLASDPLEKIAFNVLKVFARKHTTYDRRGDFAERRRQQQQQSKFNATFGLQRRGNSVADPLGLMKDQGNKQKSPPGSPPFTRGLPGKNLPDAVRFEVTAEGDLVVFVDDTVGPVGGLMEDGGERNGANYAPRPYLRPALEKAAYPFLEEWGGQIGV